MILLTSHITKILAIVDPTAWSPKKPMIIVSFAAKEKKVQMRKK
jgi:hypothetical protein